MAAPIERKPGLTATNPVQLFLTRTQGRGSSLPNVQQQYDVAQDGRFLINTSLNDSVLTPLTTVVNWTQLLQEH